METSADGVHWQRDARYFYYPHGPLERTELGAHVVQGTDYAYTLQGWLKGINGDRLDQRTDMGRDGDPSLSPNPNLNVGRDAFAMSLGYYGDADYKGIGTAWDDDQPATIAQRPFAPIGMPGIGSTLATAHKPLYNGNIAHTVNSLQPFGLWGPNGQGQVLAQVYAYDQLNRLKKARGVIGLDVYNTWEGVDDDAATNRYRSQYEYDANGNILSAERYDADGTGHYDSFEYHYQMNGTRLQRNRLYELFDDAPTTTGDDIVAPTGTFDNSIAGVNANNNYRYDALGNLIRDERAEIHAIDWTVAGKVRGVERTLGSTLKPLQFAYGASGQRIMKQVGEPGTDAGAYREHYIRDAQGNIMATYRFTNPGSISFQLTERPIYGSSRVGSYAKTRQLYNEPTLGYYGGAGSIIQRPDLRYELTDHLGNVAAVVTGRLLPSQSLAPNEADLVGAQGYEPFGSLMPGRNYSSDSYAHGFNGMRKDDEMHNATGTSYDFGARLYDPRVGRWLSTDPHAAKYPSFSPYNAFANNPVIIMDVDGRDIVIAKSVSAADRDAIVSAMQKLTNDKLVMIQLADGAIKVLAPARTDGDQVKGTDMLRSLIDSEHTTTIVMSTSTFTHPSAQVTDAPALKEEEQWTNGTGADATVRLKNTDGIEGTLVRDRATGVVSRETSSFEMVLGHELIHALRGVLGVATDGYIDATITFPDEHGNMQTETYSQDEYKTIGVKGFRSYNGTTENALREEQCVPTDRLSHDEK